MGFDWFAEAGSSNQTDLAANRRPAGSHGRVQDRGGQRVWQRTHAAWPGRANWHRRRRVTGAAGLALSCAVAGGIAGALAAAHRLGSELHRSYSLGLARPVPASRPASSIAGIAARDMPAVVMIKVDGAEGTGSGFIIKGGFIVTDNHVVTLDSMTADASIRVYFSNGRSAAGEVVGRDPYSDIAVIRTPVTGLPALPLGNSADVDVGDPVIAIGSPLGLADTVTSGIVSAVNRPVQPSAAGAAVSRVFFDAIQTDAPINPGNSGGPLVNAQGQVVGVDAALDTLGADPLTGTEGGSIGLGFAIPVNQARRVIVQLIRTGYATHSVIGATLNGQYGGTGAQILTGAPGRDAAVVPGGPAARAGLRPGDVIRRLGSLSVTNACSLLAAIRSLPPGSRVGVTFVRQGRIHRTQITLGSARS